MKIFITVPFPTFESTDGTKKIELLAETEHKFFNSQDNMTLEFDKEYKTAKYFNFDVRKIENSKQAPFSNIQAPNVKFFPDEETNEIRQAITDIKSCVDQDKEFPEISMEMIDHISNEELIK